MASVLQMTHMLLCHGGLLKSNAFTGTLHLASYWAAVVHDFEHGGLNNDFLIKTADPIALMYNDQSPLENHHLASAFRIFIDPNNQYMAVRLPVQNADRKKSAVPFEAFDELILANVCTLLPSENKPAVHLESDVCIIQISSMQAHLKQTI